MFGTNNLKSEVIGSNGTWSESPDNHNGHLSTVNLSEVTKIEVYKNKKLSLFGSDIRIACIIFYSVENIIAAPFAAAFTGYLDDLNSLKSNFIDKCPGNGYKCDKTYEIPKEKKLIGFEF